MRRILKKKIQSRFTLYPTSVFVCVCFLPCYINYTVIMCAFHDRLYFLELYMYSYIIYTKYCHSLWGLSMWINEQKFVTCNMPMSTITFRTIGYSFWKSDRMLPNVIEKWFNHYIYYDLCYFIIYHDYNAIYGSSKSDYVLWPYIHFFILNIL